MDGNGFLLRYWGRDLGIEDLEIVRATTTRDWARGRSAIARSLCELRELVERVTLPKKGRLNAEEQAGK